jgi:hypothetical protein
MGVVMNVYPIVPVARSKRTKRAKLKSGVVNIAHRYSELLRLRGQVYELESTQQSTRSAHSRPLLSRSDQADYHLPALE